MSKLCHKGACFANLTSRSRTTSEQDRIYLSNWRYIFVKQKIYISLKGGIYLSDMRCGAGLSNQLGTPAPYSRRPEYEITHFDPGNDDADRSCNVQRATQRGILTGRGKLDPRSSPGSKVSQVFSLVPGLPGLVLGFMSLFRGPRSPRYFPRYSPKFKVSLVLVLPATVLGLIFTLDIFYRRREIGLKVSSHLQETCI